MESMPRKTCTVSPCSDPVKGHGMCSKHWQRWRKHGDPLAGPDKRRNGEYQALLQAAAFSTADECVLVTGWKTRPNVAIGDRQVNASRAVWAIAHGDPGTAFVLHTCHRGAEGCVNIRHLYLGDQAQNGRDMAVGGRRKGIVTVRGERAPKAKLTEDSVREIRRRHAAGESQVSLGKAFNVSQPAIGYIVRRESWAHIDDDQK